MQCPKCGTDLPDDARFCRSCGADVAAVVAPLPTPVAPPQPTAPLPQAVPGAAPPPQAGYGPPPVMPPPTYGAGPGYAPVPGYAPAPGYAPVQPPAKKGHGLVIGIVIGVVALLLVCGGVAVFFLWPKGTPTPTPAANTTATVAATSTPATTPPTATPDPNDYEVVTEAEARDVVTKFLTLRAAKDIAGSKALCTAKMLASEDGQFVNDKYWNPDSFEITKFTPDQMYIHVTSMGIWPSGREATIFQVYREPESGKVLIDGFLDPEQFPELVTP